MPEPIEESTWVRLRYAVRAWWRTRLRPLCRPLQWPVLLVVALLTVWLGYCGFGQYYAGRGDPRGLWDLLYRSLQLFVLESGWVEGDMPAGLQVARFLAPLLAARAAIGALAVIFQEQFQQFRLLLSRNHVVVCGLGRRGMGLVRDFCQAGHTVVVVESHKDNDSIAVAKDEGATVLVGDAAARDQLRRARVCRARYVLATCGDDRTNVECAVQTYRLVGDETGQVRRRVSCFVHIVDPRLRAWFKQRRMCTEMRDHFAVSVFDIYANSARLLIERHPLERDLAGPEDERQVHLVVVGFGQMGESVAVQAAKVGHYANLKRLRVSVIDQGAGAKEQVFAARYPFLRQVCDIEFVEGDAEHPALLRQVVEWVEDPGTVTTVVVTFDDDSRSLSYAIGLSKRLGESSTRILARMADDSGLARSLEESVPGADLTAHVSAFGMMAHVCSRRILLSEMLDRRAKAIHQHFLEVERGRNPDRRDRAMQAWDNLPDLLKDSNREGAAHIPVKLRAVGCCICAQDEPWDAIAGFEPAEVELMARMEHARWTAQYKLDGWQVGPDRDDDRKIHPWLIPWEELPEEARAKNRDFVNIIPAVLALTGQKVARIADRSYPPEPPPFA